MKAIINEDFIENMVYNNQVLYINWEISYSHQYFMLNPSGDQLRASVKDNSQPDKGSSYLLEQSERRLDYTVTHRGQLLIHLKKIRMQSLYSSREEENI